MKNEILSPLNDYVFKRLLGDQDHIELLSDFLQSVLDLPARDYQGLEIVDPKMPGKYPRDKKGILDIKVNSPTGKVIDIEVQVDSQSWLSERILFYTAGMVMDQMGQGDGYDKIKRAISIVVADHHFTKKVGKRYHHRYILYDPEAELENREYARLFEIHILEIPKLPKTSDGSKIWEWLRFFSTRKEGDFKMISKKDPMLKKAWGRLKELSADENERLLAQAREKERRDRDIMRISGLTEGMAKGMRKGKMQGLKLGLEKGMEKGMEKGRKVGIKEMAVKALRQGLSAEVVAGFTGLSKAEIEKLAKT